MSRLTLSDADKQARDWFVDTTRSLGCKISIDAMGNTFAIRPGRQPGPPTCAGSHLDTQPMGGRYDGILGVCAGVEMLRVLHDHKIETNFPIGVINWTNEEGARFPISMLASGVWAGATPISTAHSLVEVGGGERTVKQELERIGYLGDMEASYKAMPLAAHFELHIEQGPYLEGEQKKIGVVKGVQAYTWSTVTITGRPTHTGTTPLPHRSDPLLTTAKLLLASHTIAAAHSALASTGILTLTPGSVNTVPGSVSFSLDVRAPSDATLSQTIRAIKAEFERLAGGEELVKGAGEVRGRGCGWAWRDDFESGAVVFDGGGVGVVEEACEGVWGVGWRGEVEGMVSGAGHDSVHTSKHCPTAMIFVPCRDGVSHNPREYCKQEDCANGAQVLMGAVLRWDGRRGV
ncbi:hypothetical protein MMC30_001267 [Trapelia coarctata]|nr:hypothetical protein [Trapelia coarctata]